MKGSYVHKEPPRALMLARRVLPIDEYIAELQEDKKVVAQRLKQRLGVSVVPIPVPLAPGETAEDFEQRFLAQHSVYATSHKVTVVAERATRFVFAQQVAKTYKARNYHRTTEATPQITPSPVSDKTERTPSASTTDARIIRKYVTLSQYRRDYKAGVFATYKAMTRDERIAEFGVPVVPIFVPLAPGETKEQYEERFIDWIRTEHSTTLDELRSSANNYKERWLRLQFAMQNGQGAVRFSPSEPRKRPHDGPIDETTTATKKRRKERECSGDEACRCDACLKRSMQSMLDKVSQLEKNHHDCVCSKSKKRPMRRDVVVVDLTMDHTDDDDGEGRQAQPISGSDSIERKTDKVEEQLQRAYDDLNEQITLNQQVLDASENDLRQHPPLDVGECTRLHDENEEMRRILKEEGHNRRKALARLILYQWRHDRSGLERILRDKTAGDVEHVQQRSHEHCLKVSSERVAVARQLPTTRDQHQNVGHRPQELHSLLQREYEVLIHFDRRLRQLLLGLLGRLPV